MEIGGCQEIDLELEADDLIGNFQFPETLDAKKEVNSDVNDRLPELHESTEPERNQRNGRYNLRKSLAWDSAFFTSAGVLDPEELSSMIIKSDKKEKHVLPGIQEELTGSTESISTLQSDSLTLESNEDDLFLDIRASIQRSSKKASNLINSSSKIAAMVLDSTAISSPKKEDFVSQNKCPKPGVKKASVLQTVRTSKSQLKPIGKLASGRSMTLDSAQSQAGSIGKTGEKNSVVLKPLKTISSSVPSTTAAKRESVGTGRVKPECAISKQGSASGRVTQLPRVSALGGSRKVLPKPAVSSKCSSMAFSTTSTVPKTRSSSSSDNSISASPRNAAKPTLMIARRNIGKSSNVSTGPSGSNPKTPSRALPKNKMPASDLSAYLKSSKISSSISPASSISEWSSASSTTSSVFNQRCNNSRSSLDTISCTSVDGENMRSDPRHKVAGQKAERQGNQGAISTSNTSKKSSVTSGTLQAPMKPSGLRLPSPKIGYFDGSSSRTPDGNQRSQSALHPGIPKNGAAASTPTRSSNGKLKSTKVPMSRMATSVANIKSGSPKAASPASSNIKSGSPKAASPATSNITSGSPKAASPASNIKSGSPKAASPASSQEKSHALVKASSVSTDVTNSSSLSFGVIASGTGETYQEAVEVQVDIGVQQVVDAGAGADTDNLFDLSLTKSTTSGDITTATGEGNYVSASEYISQTGDGLVKKDELEKNSVPTSEPVKKDEEPASYPGEGVTGNHEPYCQLLSDTSECVVSSTAAAAASKSAACRSPPIALKNFSCGSECADTPTQLVIPVAESTGIALPSSDSEYVIQTEDNLTKDEAKKNSIPTSGAMEKENDPSNYQGEGGLTEDKKGVYQKNQEPNWQLVIDTSECVLSSTAAASESAACRSPPISLKNFSCGSECADTPTQLVIPVAVAESTGVASPSSGSEYIIQAEDGLTKDEPKKNLIPTSEAPKKENDPSNYQGEGGLTEDKEGVYQKKQEPNCQLVNLLTEDKKCVTAAASEAAVHRTPFAVKNFSCSKECVDKPTAVAIQVAVAANTLPSSEEKENS